ncbi:3-oxoacyl-(acyl-carrier-protein) reductase [Candidatus Nitrososphaera gargensis Ga9.2]|uniref:3-oxoacyl-(Acyl-carrier-protein) reductase n=2 Tax=Candidatus Nitrososphaera gargensis TaxID=497727 RepID=K0I7V2_NITGG|nr:3-oxoacyl-(acyl-carrier-protein) reductase [Candidatus Nitrososphaera gargensis Ga9.2]
MIKGKVAMVTGAGGGVGKAISKRLASEGCKVVLLGRDRAKLQKAASEIGDKKNTMTIITDITKEAEVLSAIDQTINSFDKIDILVNNAGIINDPVPFHEMTDDQWDDLIKTNLIGTFRMTKAVIPVMIKNGGGSIVNISSVLGIRSIPNVPLSVYGVTKAGVIMFTRSIAVEYGQYKIRCNCIAPSTIRSSIIEPYLQDEGAKKLLESTFPLRKIGEPEDIAGAVAYLCSDDSKWVTGTVMMIDGGISAKQ